jgi:hypothetical protein
MISERIKDYRMYVCMYVKRNPYVAYCVHSGFFYKKYLALMLLLLLCNLKNNLFTPRNSGKNIGEKWGKSRFLFQVLCSTLCMQVL